MDNNGAPPYPYPYPPQPGSVYPPPNAPFQYPYPPYNSSNVYPPPQAAPSNHESAPSPYPYPYPYPYAYPYPYPHQAPPTAHNAPQPNDVQYNSLDDGSSPQNYPQAVPNPGFENQSLSASLGEHFGSMRLSTSASPPAPAAPGLTRSSLSIMENRSGPSPPGRPQRTQSLPVVPFQSPPGSISHLLLHGNLDIWIHEAKNLPNMDKISLGIFSIPSRKSGNEKNTSDPYVTVSIANAVIARTYVIENCENPEWRQHFSVPVAHYATILEFSVKDHDVVGSELIGAVAVPVEQIYSGQKLDGSFPVLRDGRRPCKAGAVLNLSIQYTPMERLSFYQQGVGAGPDYEGVPGTYFPLRKGGYVTLYQDAHVPDGSLPDVMLDDKTNYVHGKCWHDVFDAIRKAQRMIYVTGWSVWHKVRLVRDAGEEFNIILGDLLRSKSQEGVRVLLLVWDDPTSRSIVGYKTDGVMQTHDEETRRFFKNSAVQVLLCPRVAGKKTSWAKSREVETIYTHHQKTVILDDDAGNYRRKIVAFVGGLDLCDGRYDYPEHPILRTLNTVHKNDYHNPTFTGETTGCPREPWHDLHSKIDGPAAYDVLANFEERWSEAASLQGTKKAKSADSLLNLDKIQDILKLDDAYCTSEDDPEAWHTQIFRSIDSTSVKGFPIDPKEATNKNLVCGKNVLIDPSIHTAYVKAIRAAQHFIYIENQYFIGSSFNWGAYKDLGANNLIPMEIALKIANKIRANERFAAYIVIPMWPEGVPTSAPTQRILFWQHKTMQMMYETIFKALVEVGLEGAYSPQDYLNFFCLANRESADESEVPISKSSAQGTPQGKCRKSRRFMIYVHSKGMIVDDEYVIVGSANINQRSMEGTRDTEIAMGAYQPHYTWARKEANPMGQIYGYRMSLWAEHTGTTEECFTNPESLECVRRMRNFGETNWRQFAADEVTEMRGHLVKYPVEVDRTGKVRSIEGCENFPDVGGKITGSFIAIQENLTI